MEHKAWVVSVDMGYGHQRAAYPLKDIAYERIVTANSDKIITSKEKKAWTRFRFSYETVSRIRTLPLIGGFLWWMYTRLESISPYYPFRDLSKPNFGSMYMHKLIRKGFISGLIDYVNRKKIPFVSTFFAPALAAIHNGLKDVYCVVTDSDINRIWVPEHPEHSKLYYLTPSEHSSKRLEAYGVPKKNIFFTGFPLPKENTGNNLEIMKKDLGNRLVNLDPNKVYLSKYKEVIKKQLGKFFSKKKTHPLTLTFAVGGAGAQKEISEMILRSLRSKIKKKLIRVNLVSGTRVEIEKYFHQIVKELGLTKYVNVVCALDKKSYFEGFNELLHETDILWTKPSELSFYVGLGIPIIIAPPIGSHEAFNQKWLVKMGAGINQENPKYVNEWLFEWINKGMLAEAAWEGFLEAPSYGTYNIEKVIFSKNKNKVKFKY